MPGPKLDGRTYGFLILAVVIAMIGTNLVAQSGVATQGAEVAAATREVANATREIASSTREVAQANARIADSINRLAEAVRTVAAQQAAPSTDQGAEAVGNIPPSNQGIQFAD